MMKKSDAGKWDPIWSKSHIDLSLFLYTFATTPDVWGLEVNVKNGRDLAEKFSRNKEWGTERGCVRGVLRLSSGPPLSK